MRLTTLQRFEFSAAHQLRGDGLESRLHGHNFEVWVGVSGPVRADTGLILPRTGLRTAVAAASSSTIIATSTRSLATRSQRS